MSISKDELSKVLNKMESDPEFKESFDDFWNEFLPAGNAKNPVNDDNLVPIFLDYLYEKNKKPIVMKWLLINELNSSSRETLFRENSLPISIIIEVWFRESGEYLREVLLPTISKLAPLDHSMEIDPSRVSEVLIKKNASELMRITGEFVQNIIKAEPKFPRIFSMILKTLDTAVSIRFPNIGFALVGGILFLRLINPVLIFPEKHKIYQGTITQDGRRALILVSKIIQALANDVEFSDSKEKYMIVCNRFIRKTRRTWKAYFYKLITGRDLVDENTDIMIPVQPEDLIAQSNCDIFSRLACPMTLNKQKEIVNTILSLEKQTTDDGSSVKLKDNDMDIHFTRFKNAGKVVCKVTIDLPMSVTDAYGAMKDNSSNSITGVKDVQVIKKYNENLQWVHSKFKFLFPFTDRDFLTLTYSEILPEDNFAMISCISVEESTNPDIPVPKEKGTVRGEILSGVIIRGGKDPNTCTLMNVIHLDLKGNSGLLPTSFMKRAVIKIQIDILNEAFPILDEKSKKLSRKCSLSSIIKDCN